jgi:uncharacterized protein YdcH (DUF465 family)
MNYDSLEAHLGELVKKHRQLDEEVERLSTKHISAELRQLKTQKLWLKDEIHRIQRQLNGSNGHG